MTKHSIVTMLMATSACILGSPAMSQTAPVQDKATAASEPVPEVAPAPGDILVTARRRTENIIDVPLAISVVSGAEISKLNITSTNELANFVPGLEFNDFTPGNSRNDRGGNRLLIFRGLNLANNGGVTGAGSMFLDGAAVIGNEIPAGMDIGAVEVLRGPQNVYFGRASMAGAVSYRTKAIPDKIEGAVETTIAERSTHRVEASIAGPIVPGLIGLRITGLDESNDGYIRNDFNNGADPRLGARSRKSISGTLEITPSDRLEIKLYANYFKDKDGPSATADIFPDSANGTGVVTNCLVGKPVTTTTGGITTTSPALATICGKVPGPSHAINYENTVIPARDAAVIFNIPFLHEGFKQQAGLQRNVLNSHAVINYRLSDYLKFQAITGYHTDAVIQVGDGIQQPYKTGASYTNYDYNLANAFRDFSQEVRLSSDPDRVFSWTVGSNYVNARNLSTADVTFTTPTGAFLPYPQNITKDGAKTYGFFAGGYLKLFDKRLTLSAEGRYQIDDRSTTVYSNPAFAVVVPTLSKDFRSFNPRVSADFDVGGRRRIYASYATGTRPGGFNSGLYSYLGKSAAQDASITDTFGPVSLDYKEERLQIGELGLKGNFAGTKGYFDINAYYGVLNNQQIRRSLLVPALGFSLGATQNTGKTEIYGLELTGNYNFTRTLSLATTFAWNHTNRLTYIDQSPTTYRLYGTDDFSGRALPNAPEFTGSAVLSYDASDESDRWMPFANAALVYRGKQWADIDNLAYIPGRATVDVRGGLANKTFRAELFITNLFNNKTYPGGNVAPDYGGNAVNGIPVSYSGFYGAYAEPRTVGGRFTAKF